MKASPNRILFLSGVDFKEKSIQVIRKTPEAYVAADWEVHYVVGRDNSVTGDYFYESIINPIGVNIHRFTLPFGKIDGLFNNVVWKAFWFRIRNVILVCQLAAKARTLIRKTDFQIIYGYEIPGVLAIRLLRFFRIKTNARVVTRFQGVLHVKEWLRKNQKFRYLSNIDAILALRTEADLCIMTNDGSQGLDVLSKVKSPIKNVLFCANGVDLSSLDPVVVEEIRARHYSNSNKKYFISISRLDAHKRIDRSIRIIQKMVKVFKFTDLKFIVIGGGSEHQKLMDLIQLLELQDYVEFLGPIKHQYVQYHMALAEIFLSMYTSTNVGNPLLEAIRRNKMIVTLNNGDTGEWIQHYVSGLIYDVNDDLDLSDEQYEIIAKDIIHILKNPDQYEKLKAGIREVETRKLWTWKERFAAELSKINELLD